MRCGGTSVIELGESFIPGGGPVAFFACERPYARKLLLADKDEGPPWAVGAPDTHAIAVVPRKPCRDEDKSDP